MADSNDVTFHFNGDVAPSASSSSNRNSSDDASIAATTTELVNLNPEPQDATSQQEKDEREDAAVLSKMGYKQELYRGFNAFMNFSFCMTSVAVISSVTLGFNNSLSVGGPGVQSVGWLVASFFTILIGLNLAEICSTYPTAGSVYHWSGMLASPGWAPFLSYVSGWFNFMGNAAGDAAYAYGFAQVVAAAVDLSDYHHYEIEYNKWYASLDPMYTTNADCNDQPTIDLLTAGPALNPTEHHMSTGGQVALSISVALLWAFKNLVRVDKQGWLNNFSSLWQMGTTAVIIIVLLAKASNLNSASWIFGDYEDSIPTGFDPKDGGPSGFNSFAYLCFIGLLNALFAQTGYEAGGHMAEETKGATRTAPMGIFWTTVATCITGFVYIMAILATVPTSAGSVSISDPVCGLGGTSFGNAVFATFYYVCGYDGGMVLAFMIIVDMFFAGFSSLTVTTRIGYAMARDDAFPGSSVLKYIWPSTQTPVFVIALVWFIDAILVLFVLVTMDDPDAQGAPVAFTAITSITVIGYQISYAIPIFQRAMLGDKFVKSALHLGKIGGPLGFITSFWLVATSCIMVFPTSYIPPGSDGKTYQYGLNYTPVVVAATMLVAAVFWIASARHSFVGPKRGQNDAVGAIQPEVSS